MSRITDAAFFDRPVLDVARALVGCVLRHGETAGRIVETEAYHHTEAACHAYIGHTSRTSTLFGPAGTAYVYRSYGIHALLNAVCEGEDVGAAVLIRALEPLDGLELMRERRHTTSDIDLCNGPGKLTQALGIELGLNASSLLTGPIALEPRTAAPTLTTGPRVGITRATELPWRFHVQGSRYVSRPWISEITEPNAHNDGQETGPDVAGRRARPS